MPVQAMDQCLNGWFLQMTQHGGGLSRFLAKDHHVGVDQAESVNDNFSFDTLDGIHHTSASGSATPELNFYFIFINLRLRLK